MQIQTIGFGRFRLSALLTVLAMALPQSKATAQFLDCCTNNSGPCANYDCCPAPYGCICPAPLDDAASSVSGCMLEPLSENDCGQDPSVLIQRKDFSDPVHLGSGEFRERLTDLSIPSRHYPIEFVRSYRSLGGSVNQRGLPESLALNPLGCGWDHNHNIFLARGKPITCILGTGPDLTRYGTHPIMVWMGSGSPIKFVWVPSNNRFESDSGAAVLEMLFDNQCRETPVIRFADGTSWWFHPYDFSSGNTPVWGTGSGEDPLQGRIQYVVHPSGDTIEYLYGNVQSAALLTSVVDLNTGRGLEFEYIENAAYSGGYLLETVTSIGDGREIHFDYEYDAHSAPGKSASLASVALPGGTAAAPVARTWSYDYQVSAVRHIWQLTEIKNPDNLVVLKNEYAVDALLRRSVVVRQEYGGNVYNYSWSRVAPSATPPDNRIVATVFNMAGQKKSLTYDASVSDTGSLSGRYLVVAEREYTGLVTNRATGARAAAMRGAHGSGPSDPEYVAGDPTGSGSDYFEVIHTYDAMNRRISTRNADGQSGIKYIYEFNTDPLRRNNLAAKWRMANVSLTSPGSEDIVESWTYGVFGGTPGCGCSSMKPESHTDGRGNVTTYAYDSYGNQISSYLPTVTAGVYGGGTQANAVTAVYGPRTTSGDTSGAGPMQISKRTLPSNGTGSRSTHFNYYTTGPSKGYLQSKVVDPGVADLTTTYEYDAAGNITKVTDPNGNDTLYTYDRAGNVILKEEPVTTNAGANGRHDTRYFYDINNNLVRIDVEQVVGSTPHWITTVIDYDILNRRTREVREASSFTLDFADTVLSSSALATVSGIDPATLAVTEYTYDANGNVASVVQGIAGITSGAFSTTAVSSTTYSHDERNKIFRETKGLGSDALIIQYNYDRNGNMVSRIEGWGLGSGARRTDWVYDAYDRLIEVKDASSTNDSKRTRWVYSYDKAGNRLTEEVYGLPDVTNTSGTAIRLSLTAHTYDERSRLILTQRGDLNPATGVLVQYLNDRRFYYPDGSLQAVRDPRSSASASATDAAYDTIYAYDNPGRLIAVLDPKGNTTEWFYDDNGNRIGQTNTEKSDVTAEPDQEFVIESEFDSMDRVIATTDGVGNESTFTYDNRGNRLTETDAKGGVTTWTYDALSRETSMTLPPGGSAATIVTYKVWDPLSRLIAQIDGNGSRTSYGYDSRGRVIATRNADGTFDQVGTGLTWSVGTNPPSLGSFVSGYDLFGNRTKSTDSRGVVVDATYDKRDRLLTRSITVPSGGAVSADTTWEAFRYDGRGMLISARDNDSLVEFSYNSLGWLANELSAVISPPDSSPSTAAPSSSAVREITYAGYDAAGNVTDLVYPEGTWDTLSGAPFPLRRHVGYAYDTLGRTASITEKSNPSASPLPSIATFGYFGPARERFRTYGNGTRTDRTYSGYATTSPTPPSNPTGSYGFGRTLTIAHT